MVKKVVLYANSLLLLTSIHHVYGAYIYDSPWRLHILGFSIPIFVFNMWVLPRILIRKKIMAYLFWSINILLTVCQIGLFEGLYNHLIKVILFYSGTSETVMASLFPPPNYEMPNDFFFELTGILQAFILFPLIYFSIATYKNSYLRKGRFTNL